MAEQNDKKTKKEARKEQRLREATARELRRYMLNFAQDERFAEAFAAALPTYWKEYYTLETAAEMDANETQRFFDWFLHDYQPEEGPRLIDLYAQEEADELTEMQQELLAEWRQAPPSGAYEYLDFDAFSQRFKLRDIFTDEELLVRNPGGVGNAKRGDIILGRPVPIGEILEFSAIAAYIPQEEADDLLETVEKARAEYTEAHPEATEEQFMRAKGHLLIHYALEKAEANNRPPVARLDESLAGQAGTVARRAGKKLKKKIKRRKK